MNLETKIRQGGISMNARVPVVFFLLSLFAVLCGDAARAEAAQEHEEFFETRIRPLLAEHCQSCHGELATSGLRVDSRVGLLKGGSRGPAILPGNPESSLLLQAVSHSHPNLKMPPSGRLGQRAVDDLATWVRAGAVWPRKTEQVSQTKAKGISEEDRSFWSFQSLRKPAVVGDSPIDELVRASLRENGLTPNPPADRRTWLRRISFDLMGLPPTPEEVSVFLADDSPQAFSTVVDRLLSSPHFGERWGRYWLDVARYGENDFHGVGIAEYPQAWRYRDWVIEAFNSDMPYDVFVKAQIAADLMPGDNRKLLGGLGLFGLGPWYYGISHPPQARADERNERVDMVSRGLLGLTVACARCHDHKYDPISMQDYYGLAGVFASVHYKSYPLASEQTIQDYKRQEKEIKDLEKEIADFLKRQSEDLARIFTRRTADYVIASWRVLSPGEMDEDELACKVDEVARRSKLDWKILERWVNYLRKPHEDHPYLDAWKRLLEDATATEEQVRQVADDYQALIVSLADEREKIEEETRTLVARLNKKKRERTQLPNKYISGDSFKFNDVDTTPMSRDRYLAWKPVLGVGNDAVLRYQGEDLERFLQGEWKRHLQSLRAELEEKKEKLPPHYPYLPGIEDWKEPRNAKLNPRGNPFQEGEEIPRRFPAVLSHGEPAPFRNGSGRLELAEAIVKQPLAARVMANRVWHHLFGSGIVRTTSNFGRTGAKPSNPKLLEYLAWRLVHQQWSIKKLIREIVLSETYRASSDRLNPNEAKDPDNRFFRRANRRRLDVEALRDAMLFVAGQLDPEQGGESKALSAENRRRTVYARVERFRPDETLALFDFPNPSASSAQRVVTNVPLQRLFFLNSDFVLQQSGALAARVRPAGSDADRIREAYRLSYAREADGSDVRDGLDFLAAAGEDGWTQYAQVLLGSNEFAFMD